MIFVMVKLVSGREITDKHRKDKDMERTYKVIYTIDGEEDEMIISGEDITPSIASDTCYYEHSDEGEYEEIRLYQIA